MIQELKQIRDELEVVISRAERCTDLGVRLGHNSRLEKLIKHVSKLDKEISSVLQEAEGAALRKLATGPGTLR